jgi:Uma2 family endonuclease
VEDKVAEMMKLNQKIGPRQRHWTRKEFYRLLDLGFFNDQRVELIGGKVVLMPAQKNFHAISIKLTEDALNAVFGPNYWVRVQMSLDLKPHSVPDPDLAVISGSVRTHDPQHNPRSALLVVEVSETTLRYDQHWKMSLYARAGIEDYWIVNLVDQIVEVHRRPIANPKMPFRFEYADIKLLSPNEHVTPLAAPHARIAIVDLLP